MFRNPDDWPVEVSVVKSVSVEDTGGVMITGESGWSYYIRPEEVKSVGVTPEVGEKSVVLGGLGFEIRGIFIGDREYRYTTRIEADKQRAEWLAEYDRKKEEAYNKNIDDWTARKEALDKPFRDRIERFIDKKGAKEFWTEDGGYELFILEQAQALLEEHAKTQGDKSVLEWLDWFYNIDWQEQKQAFPGLDEGHSGNTFGGMVYLARSVAAGQQI